MNFNRGREALAYFILKYKINRIWIPYYLCDAVRHTLMQINCKPLFYHIDDYFFPAMEFPESDYILYPNYFGICQDNVEKLVEKYNNIVIDNAHAYYSEPQGIASFYCNYKFGYQGASLFFDGNKRENLDISNMERQKSKFLLLYDTLYSTNKLKFKKNIIPYVYPYLADTIEEADKIVEQLKKEGKTIYRLWNQIPKSYNEYKFYSRLVPIPLS